MHAGTAAAKERDLVPAGAAPDQPVATGERIVTLDFIRGIAVLGILFANVVAYSNPILAYFWPPALPGARPAESTSSPDARSGGSPSPRGPMRQFSGAAEFRRRF